ncbi:MAG: pilus assembly protein PilM [Candidatus Omnitrophota bacterium]
MKSKTKQIRTVIEFSTNAIKIVQSSINNKRIITKLFCQDITKDLGEYEFAKELEKAIKANHLKIGELIVSLDRSLVTIRSIKLPSINENEVKDMAQWQAAKILPYKIEEIVVAHQTIKIDENSFSHILLVVVPRNIIKKFTNVCEYLKLQPKIITLSSAGLLHWYINQPSQPVADIVLLVDVDKHRVELVIIDNNKFIFSRSFSLIQVKDKRDVINKIVNEARLSIDYYHKQETSQQINKIVLTGDKSGVSDLAPLFESEFNLPVEIIDHLQNLDLDKGAIDLDKKDNVSFSSVSGLVLTEKLPEINLCPQEIKNKILYLEKKNQLVKSLVSLLFGVLILTAVFTLNFNNKNNIISILDNKIEEIKPTAEEIQTIKNKIAIINSQLSTENSCIEILRELHKITPAEISLETFIFEDQGEVTLKGTSPAMSLVFSFVPILNKSTFFENIQVKYATQRKTKIEELTDFEIICKIKYK